MVRVWKNVNLYNSCTKDFIYFCACAGECLLKIEDLKF